MSQAAPAPVGVADAVYSVGDFPLYAHDLAPGEGQAVVQAHCSVCHSLAYIYVQPPFPPSVWEAEVRKMVQAYGASIPDGDQIKIVSYLNAVYGLNRRDEAVAGNQTDRVYLQNCAMCHQAGGSGLPGAYPPLAKHAAALAQAATGRTYMINVVLYGLLGPITVDGVAYNNVMPGLGGRLSDQEIAEALNHVLQAWGNAASTRDVAPITADDVARQRAVVKTPRENLVHRP